MPCVALTDRFCSTAKALGVRTDYFDTIVPGLALRVTNHGHRSWSYHFTSPRDDKRARATIGTYPATSLAAARGKALEARGHVELGKDPRLVLAGQQTAGMTLGGLIDAYLADPEKAALRSRPEIERRLRKNVVPVIGAVKVRELHRRDVRNVTDAILRRGCKAEATRVFEDVRAVVRWAVQEEYLDANPLDGVGKPAEASTSNRVLADDEIIILWNGLSKALPRSRQCQRIIRLCLVTAQRVGEVAGMLPSELDLKAREWRLPGKRTKNGHPHVVPLSDLAISIIREAAVEAGEGRPIFPCGEGTLSARAVARTISRANEMTKERPMGRFGIASWSAHDLRRTALTGMARLGVAPIVLGHVANHRSVTRAGGDARGLFAIHLRQGKALSARSLGQSAHGDGVWRIRECCFFDAKAGGRVMTGSAIRRSKLLESIVAQGRRVVMAKAVKHGVGEWMSRAFDRDLTGSKLNLAPLLRALDALEKFNPGYREGAFGVAELRAAQLVTDFHTSNGSLVFEFRRSVTAYQSAITEVQGISNDKACDLFIAARKIENAFELNVAGMIAVGQAIDAVRAELLLLDAEQVTGNVLAEEHRKRSLKEGNKTKGKIAADYST